MTLYDDLGVDKNASAAAIKSAWRKRAQQAHPDKGGDEQTFHAIQKAYETLSDSRSRAHYDETGQTPDAMNELQQQLAGMVMAFVDGADDVTIRDLVGAMRGAIRDAIKQSKLRALDMERVLKKRQAALERFKHKGKGRNIIAEVLLAAIAAQERNIEHQGEQSKQGAAMLKLLAEYEYETDRRADEHPMPVPTVQQR